MNQAKMKHAKIAFASFVMMSFFRVQAATRDEQIVDVIVESAKSSASFADFAALAAPNTAMREDLIGYLEDQGLANKRMINLEADKNFFIIKDVIEADIKARFDSQPRPRLTIASQVIYVDRPAKDIAAGVERALRLALAKSESRRMNPFWSEAFAQVSRLSAPANEIAAAVTVSGAAAGGTEPPPLQPLVWTDRMREDLALEFLRDRYRKCEISDIICHDTKSGKSSFTAPKHDKRYLITFFHNNGPNPPDYTFKETEMAVGVQDPFPRCEFEVKSGILTNWSRHRVCPARPRSGGIFLPPETHLKVARGTASQIVSAIQLCCRKTNDQCFKHVVSQGTVSCQRELPGATHPPARPVRQVQPVRQRGQPRAQPQVR